MYKAFVQGNQYASSEMIGINTCRWFIYKVDIAGIREA